MKKIRLSFLLLSLLLTAVGARADEITVNDGTATSAYVPIYGYYADAYTRSQFIVPADDLTIASNSKVTKMTFYSTYQAVDWGNAKFKISLSEQVGEAFVSDESYAFKEDGLTEVFNGSLSVMNGLMEVEFDTPYEYGGGNLLVDFSQIEKGNYRSVVWTGVTAAVGSVLGYSYTSLDAITNYSSMGFLPKVTFEYTFGAVNTCKVPKNLTVSDITSDSAVLSWTSDGDMWQVCLNGDENNLIDVTDNPTTTLLNLDPGTLNTVKVRSVCGKDEVSNWTDVVSFLTDCQEVDKCFITYELTAGYGGDYGWFNAAIKVVDHDTGELLDTWTLASGEDSKEGDFGVCQGRTIDFVWQAGAYDDELCAYTIKDVSGEVIVERELGGTFSSGVHASYTVDCNVETDCLTPADLAVSNLTAHSATLSWTERGTSTSWKVSYMGEKDDKISEVVANENPFILTGLDPETTYVVLVAPTCNEDKQTKVVEFTTPAACLVPEDVEVATDIASAEISWTGFSDSYNVQYREASAFSFDFEEGNLGEWTAIRNGEGNTDTDWHVVKANTFYMNDEPLAAHSGEYALVARSYVYGAGGFQTDNWLISPQTTLDGTLSFWVFDDGYFHEHCDVYVSTTDNQISSFEKFAEVGDATNEWTQVTIDLTSFKGKKGYIALRHQDYDQDMIFIDDITITLPGSEWTTINTNEETVEITGLSSETKYEYQIQGVCEEADSKWVSGYFTTLESCPVPFNVAVKPKATTATVTWKGNSESYNVRYRKPGSSGQIFFEDFETGIPGSWTIIDNDGDEYNWFYYNPSDNNQEGLDNLGNPTVFDNACATSASYVGGIGALTPDNWLISPQLDLQGTLSVWLRGQDPSWAQEKFAIYLSTTGNEIVDFTTELVPETTATGIYTEYTADLSEYAGQKGYIAIRHFNCSDMFRLNVDNFAILVESSDASEWLTLTTDELTAKLTGLEPNTEYELQVQGVCDNLPTEWSNSVLFSTLPAAPILELLDDDLAQPEGSKNTDLIQANYGKLVSVMLKDRVFYKDGNWNSLCLPFNLTDEEIANSPLAGATIKKLSSASVTGTHVDMSFTTATEITPDMVYIFKWNEQGEDIVNPVFYDVTIDYYDHEGPILYASGYHFFAVGNYSTIVADPAKDDVYAYYLGADNKLRYSKQPVNLHTFRVFFNFYKTNTDPYAVQFNLNFDGDEATGIMEVEGEPNATEGTYNLQGVKVNEPKQKGVYIQNGRKVVVK